MFSGIVEEVGRVLELVDSAAGRWLKIGATTVTQDAIVGASISVSGTCLTVVELQGDWFAVEATFETLRCTTLGRLAVGGKVNLERALRLSDRLGGHLVSGHVDCVGKVVQIEEEGFSRLLSFELDPRLAPFFVEKGSVAVEGVSLTVVDFEPRKMAKSDGRFSFRVALIPHTLDVTTLGTLTVGDEVNIETDMVARYVARWTLPYLGENLNKEQATFPFALDKG